MLLCSLWFCSEMPLAAERELQFQQLSLQAGLSQGDVTAVLQDRSGFLWVGTQGGLNRYDGHGFEAFTSDSSGLDDDHIVAIAQDPEGDLWVGTRSGGVYHFAADSEIFVKVSADSPLSDDVRDIAVDSAGIVWIGTAADGLARFDPASGSLRRFERVIGDNASLSDNRIRALLIDASGSLWVATLYGLNRFVPNGERFVRYLSDASDPTTLVDSRVRTLFEDSQRRLWIGTYQGLNQLDRFTDQIIRYGFIGAPTGVVRAIADNESRGLWVGTDEGVGWLEPQQKRYSKLVQDPTATGGLTPERITSLTKDRAGLVWIGTQGQGLSKWNPRSLTFAKFTHKPEDPASLNSNSVMAFAQADEGRVWVGTFGGGLNLFDPRTQEFQSVEVPDRRVMSLLESEDGTLWVGSMTGTLAFRKKGEDEFRTLSHDPSDPLSLSANRGITALLQTGDGSVWAGTYGGGLNRSRADLRFEHYRFEESDPDSISNAVVISLAEGADGGVWAGTERGLNYIDIVSGKAQRVFSDPNDTSTLASDFIYALHVDETGALWAGTKNGLNAVRRDSGTGNVTVIRYGRADGLPNSDIYGIQPGTPGHLWVSTNDGLYRFSPDRRQSKRFDETHGLQSREFNFGAHGKTPDHLLLFGGPNGFNIFDPSQLTESQYQAPIAWVDFRKLNRSIPTAERRRLPIELDYGDSMVTFKFALLDFAAPQNNRLSYQLDGYSDQWLELGSQGEVTLTGIDSGDYTLRVRGANSEGILSAATMAIPLVVRPPLWLSPAAYTLYGLLLLFGAFLASRLQRQRLQRIADRRYRTLVNLSEGYIFTHTLGGHLLSLNPAASKVLGQGVKLNGSINFADFLTPESKLEFQAFLKQIPTTGGAVGVLAVVAADNSVRQWAYQNVLYEEPGEAPYVMGFALDISELRAAQDALEASEARYQKLYDTAPDLHFAVDQHGIITAVNEFGAGHLGYRKLELVGRRWEEIVCREDCDGALAELSSAFTGGPTNDEFEFRLVAKDGTLVWVHQRVSSGEGNDDTMQVVCRDISDRRKADIARRELESQMRNAQKLESLGIMAGGIAHDFNNMLAAILSNAELGELNLSEASAAANNLREIKSLTRSASELTAMLLAYTGKSKLVQHSMNLTALVEKMSPLLKRVIGPQVRIEYDLDSDGIFFQGDEGQISQIIINLVTNASESMEGSVGTIRVSTKEAYLDQAYLDSCQVSGEARPGDYAMLSIADDGAGMWEETVSRIFDPFFTTKFVGRGLGLAATSGVVNSHRGAIHVTSALGEGTVMTVALPVAGVATSGSADDVEIKSENPNIAEAQTGTVLLIDDELALRKVNRIMLSRHGFEVLTAQDGAEGVDVYREHASSIGAVVVDMTMPKLNGAEVIEAIRRDSADVPIILMSGYNAGDSVSEELRAELVGYLQKPFESAALLSLLAHAFQPDTRAASSGQ